MTQYSKFNFIYHLQKWMDSVPGQTFLNYGYSWGAQVMEKETSADVPFANNIAARYAAVRQGLIDRLWQT